MIINAGFLTRHLKSETRARAMSYAESLVETTHWARRCCSSLHNPQTASGLSDPSTVLQRDTNLKGQGSAGDRTRSIAPKYTSTV